VNDEDLIRAKQLGISLAAVELYTTSDVIDLHIESFTWQRVAGYDLNRRHDQGVLAGRYFRQADLPRIMDARITGATWVITTNPFRRAARQADVLRNNLRELEEIFSRDSDKFAIVGNVREYRAARKLGKHGAFIGVQGGNSLAADASVVEEVAHLLLRVTLLHLTSSALGSTGSPLALGGDNGLTGLGVDIVRRLNAARIFVDLAHIGPKGFRDAVAAHDPSQPLLVTHTGVCGVYDHWRNLDDDQLRAIADSGGTVGVMFHGPFLGPGPGRRPASCIVDHLAHIIHTVGEDHASLGSDWDGGIVTPMDMPTCTELPRLVQLMLDRGWTEDRIRKILGGNFLRVVAALRG